MDDVGRESWLALPQYRQSLLRGCVAILPDEDVQGRCMFTSCCTFYPEASRRLLRKATQVSMAACRDKSRAARKTKMATAILVELAGTRGREANPPKNSHATPSRSPLRTIGGASGGTRQTARRRDSPKRRRCQQNSCQKMRTAAGQTAVSARSMFALQIQGHARQLEELIL